MIYLILILLLIKMKVNFYNLKGKKTIIMIAHRLTTLKNCDKIFEIKNGKNKGFENKILVAITLSNLPLKS